MSRRVPHLPLPRATFVQGQSPRPPDGWADDVGDDDAFAFGCDCFDAGCFFEAHELWERLWLKAKAAGDHDDAALLQGLIKLAAAGVKALAGQTSGVRSHLDGAAACFARVGRWGRGLSSDVVDGLRAAVVAIAPGSVDGTGDGTGSDVVAASPRTP